MAQTKFKNSTFLAKLYAAMRELFSANSEITRDQFEAAFKTARGHAGGKAYPPAEAAETQAMECPECGAAIEGDMPAECPECGAALDMAEDAAQASELADIAAAGHTHQLFNSIVAAEPPTWIPYLPKPATYQHPRYGEIVITRDRNARFVAHFASKIYQDRLPIDAEHETKLSGAVGWIVGMRQNNDGSVDARVEWTDRAAPLFSAERFRYFSPEWYDAWQRPETGEIFKDVAIGGALTTRPFFKDPALRPLFASERALLPDEPPTQGVDMADQQFAELTQQLDALRAENAALKQAGEAGEASNKQLAERLAAVEQAAQQQRIYGMVTSGPRWFGEVDAHVAVITTLAQTFGEDSTEVKAYVQAQRATAEALKQSKIFEEIGSDGDKAETGAQKLDRLARERAAAAGVPFAQAYTEVLGENPALYSAAV